METGTLLKFSSGQLKIFIKGKGHQGTCKKDPWTKTTEGVGSRVGGGGWVGKGRVMGEKWGQLKLNNNKK